MRRIGVPDILPHLIHTPGYVKVRGVIRATITVPEAGRILGVSRNTAYAAAARGELPVVRIGRRVLIPRQRFLEMLGIAREASAAEAANKLAAAGAARVGGAI